MLFSASTPVGPFPSKEVIVQQTFQDLHKNHLCLLVVADYCHLCAEVNVVV